MRNLVAIVGSLVIVIITNGCCRQAEVQPVASVGAGPYFGQTPAGDVPQVFAPDYLPDIGSEHTATMFMHAKQVDGVWGEPQLAPFNIGINSFIDSVSPDGNRIYFQANHRSEKDGETIRRWTNWVVHRTDDGWSEPRLLEADFSWPNKFFDFQETNSGNLRPPAASASSMK